MVAYSIENKKRVSISLQFFFDDFRVFVSILNASFLHNFTGAESVILKMRNQLKSVVEAERERFFHTNALRNPFRDVELYILPMGIAAVAWICSVIVNATCSTDFCEKTEDTFVNVYLFIFFGIVVLTWRHIAGALGYAKDILLPLIMQASFFMIFFML